MNIKYAKHLTVIKTEHGGDPVEKSLVSEVDADNVYKNYEIKTNDDEIDIEIKTERCDNEVDSSDHNYESHITIGKKLK